MDTAQWPQDVIGVVKTVEKKPRPQKEEALNCPRCSSTNTKFCYYNNYSLSQPRYFCKTCRRYWTEGGSLRNVPVGGGTRKNKRSSSSSSPSAIIFSAKKKVITNYQDDLSPPNLSPTQNPKTHEAQDLNLDYNPSHYEFGPSGFDVFPFFGLENKNIMNPKNPSFSNTDPRHLPVMEFFKPGNINIVGPDPVYNPSGFPVVHDFKPSLGFSADGLYGNFQGVDDHANSSKEYAFSF